MRRPGTRLAQLSLGVVGSLALLAPALASPGAPAPVVQYVAAPAVQAAFEQGMPLIETSTYKIHASRREAPGKAEVHVLDTDVIYVLDGGATFVTGGSVVDGKAIAPDEIRGASIRGGEMRHLAKGDVVVVPSGTPHQFVEVTPPLLYYVVKVTDRKEQAR